MKAFILIRLTQLCLTLYASLLAIHSKRHVLLATGCLDNITDMRNKLQRGFTIFLVTLMHYFSRHFLMAIILFM